MYIGEQLIAPTDDRLRLSAQLGCRGIVVDTVPTASSPTTTAPGTSNA